MTAKVEINKFVPGMGMVLEYEISIEVDDKGMDNAGKMELIEGIKEIISSIKGGR
ncbi:hypothetical protein [Sulfuricurvum sp.]|uniref:hypothetical protein n=1 Tax=Sulfuricurvum sp. TaxID=2025608 RepID=UPI00356808F5